MSVWSWGHDKSSSPWACILSSHHVLPLLTPMYMLQQFTTNLSPWLFLCPPSASTYVCIPVVHQEPVSSAVLMPSLCWHLYMCSSGSPWACLLGCHCVIPLLQQSLSISSRTYRWVVVLSACVYVWRVNSRGSVAGVLLVTCRVVWREHGQWTGLVVKLQT